MENQNSTEGPRRSLYRMAWGGTTDPENNDESHSKPLVGLISGSVIWLDTSSHGQNYKLAQKLQGSRGKIEL